MAINYENLKKNFSLKDKVTFKLGGSAEYFFEATSIDNLIAAVDFAKNEKIPWFILGGGSNLVISDSGIDGLVIHNKCCEIANATHENQILSFSSGVPLSFLVNLSLELGYTGSECFAGIPGSIGGALCGNAGAYGRCIADILVNADVLYPDGSIHTVSCSFFQYDYRTSKLKKETGYVILKAEFQLTSGDKKEIKARINEIIEQRKSKHPSHEIGCAGSFFKNLPPQSGENRRRAAGELLEKVGAKTMTYGGASVFDKHANFIVNKGKASASDVKQLANMLKKKVFEQFEIELFEEVQYVGHKNI